MNSNPVFDFSVDRENKAINVNREFAAPLNLVWAAWTQSALLDHWWAPKPWKSQTKTMDFTNGGHWLYAMVGPDGETHWSRSDFQLIDAHKSFSAQTAFTDENGNVDSGFPQSTWSLTFDDNNNKATMVHIVIQYDSLNDLEKEIEMGFKEGFSMGLENLDGLLASQR